MDPDAGDRVRFTTIAGIEKDFDRLRTKMAPATFFLDLPQCLMHRASMTLGLSSPPRLMRKWTVP
jgi:hypothetical protein